MSSDANSRIKYALHSRTWDPHVDSHSELRRDATHVVASDYVDSMHGYLYCPGCYTSLTRTPRDKPYFANGRRACFAHLPTNRNVPCDLRSSKPEGKLYLTEEEAAQAVSREDLVIVGSFMRDKPEALIQSGEYDQTPVEDIAGPIADVPIARHRGKTFRLPTRISTVSSLCRRFDENLYRYYVLPGSSAAVRLVDALTDVATVTDPNPTPALYFGEIVSSFNPGRPPKPTNTRMTALRCHPSVKDFHIKVKDQLQAEKGISDTSRGRIVLFWGTVTVSGIGLAAERLQWGEFALLPTKYDSLLRSDGT